MATSVSGRSKASGASKPSPRSMSGGWPRNDGNDRSGDVVFSAEPLSATARIASSTSSPMVMVPAGDSCSERAPSRNVVASPKSTYVECSERRITKPLSTTSWSFIGPSGRSSEYQPGGYSVRCWLTDSPTIVPASSQRKTFTSRGISSRPAVTVTAVSTGRTNSSASASTGSTMRSVYSSNCAFSMGSRTRRPSGSASGSNAGLIASPARPTGAPVRWRRLSPCIRAPAYRGRHGYAVRCPSSAPRQMAALPRHSPR